MTVRYVTNQCIETTKIILEDKIYLVSNALGNDCATYIIYDRDRHPVLTITNSSMKTYLSIENLTGPIKLTSIYELKYEYT